MVRLSAAESSETVSSGRLSRGSSITTRLSAAVPPPMAWLPSWSSLTTCYDLNDDGVAVANDVNGLPPLHALDLDPHGPLTTPSFFCDTGKRRTLPFVGRLIERRVVGLVDHRSLEHDLLRHVFLARAAHRHFQRDASQGERVVVAAADDVAGFDQLHGLAAGVDGDDLRLAAGGFERVDSADRHRIVGGKDAVDLRISAQQLRSNVLAGGAGVIGRFAGQQPDVGKLLDGVAKALGAPCGGAVAVGTVEDHDVAFALQRLDEIAAGVFRQGNIVDTDIARDRAALEAFIGIEQRDLRGIDLVDGTLGFAEVYRVEHDGRRLVLDGVVDELVLIGDVVRCRRHIVDHFDAETFRRDT